MGEAEPVTSGDPDVGDVVGRFRLEAPLGEGAVGKVFRATDSQSGETVALKVLKRALSQDETFRRRFFREARVARDAPHRHLVPVLDVGADQDVHYLAVAYMPGGSLEDRLAAGPLSLEDTLRLAAEVGAGLDALHDVGLVHRDVKPANILLDDDGTASLTDFGLARGRAYTVLTRPGFVMGTIDYLAPELITGAEPSPASDVYGLGCVLYEALTGAAPFASLGMFEVAVGHLEHDPPDPGEKREDVGPELSWVLLQALAKEPAERPPTATAYAHMLHAAARGTRGSS